MLLCTNMNNFTTRYSGYEYHSIRNVDGECELWISWIVWSCEIHHDEIFDAVEFVDVDVESVGVLYDTCDDNIWQIWNMLSNNKYDW